MSETAEEDSRNVYSIDVTPSMLKELLEKGQIEQEQSDGAVVFLNYNWTPKYHSEGFQE